MSDLTLSATVSGEGTTERLWRSVRGPVDLVFVDAGASGELLAARTRVHIAVLLIVVHALRGFPASADDAAVLLLALTVLAYALFVREFAARPYPVFVAYATSLIDVSCATLALALLWLCGDPAAPLSSVSRFPLYFLAISLASLKMNWRISALAGALSAIQYAGILAMIAWVDDAAVDWPLQLGRLAMLLGAGYLGTVTVLRAQQLTELSTTDFLTRLPNRAVLDGRLADEVSRARRHHRRFALALVDLDRFKQFNDLHGHPGGDAALRELAELLRDSVRESDLVARYGGEEFAILLPEAGLLEAGAKLEALRHVVEATPLGSGPTETPRHLTLSAGLAEYPADGKSVAALLAAADSRLYEAKRTGRNRIVMSDAPPSYPVAPRRKRRTEWA
jgi:diguanylate cyclase (GGDEF)-like protein